MQSTAINANRVKLDPNLGLDAEEVVRCKMGIPSPVQLNLTAVRREN